MRTITLIQNMEHSYMVVSRKYTTLYWRNNTKKFFRQIHVLLKNFPKRLVCYFAILR